MQDPYFPLTDSFEHQNSMLFFLFERLFLDMEKFFLSAAHLLLYFFFFLIFYFFLIYFF